MDRSKAFRRSVFSFGEHHLDGLKSGESRDGKRSAALYFGCEARLSIRTMSPSESVEKHLFDIGEKAFAIDRAIEPKNGP
jgi:hypothetical protein